MQKNKKDQLQYDEWWSNFTSANIDDPGTIYRVNRIIKKIKSLKVKDVVDAGCGSGELLKKIWKKTNGLKLSGFDVSQKIIERNKNLYSEIDFFCLNLNEPDISLNKKFDMVINCEVIEHLHEWQRAISTLSNLTKNNGYLLITTQSGKIFNHHKVLGHIQHFKKEDLESEMKINNLEIIESSYAGWPFMNLKNIILSLLFKDIKKSTIITSKKGVANKLAFRIFSYLYSISSQKRGPQIFILAQKIS